MGEESGACKLPHSVPLLNVLAEVASAQLKNEKESATKKSPHSGTSPRKSVKKVEVLTLDQIRVLSDKMLLEMFAELKCDEIRRHFSYTCYLLPDKCTQVFNSFGSENKARHQMKSHLHAHIAVLIAEDDALEKSHKAKFTAEPLQARRRRLQEGDVKKKRRGRTKSQTKRIEPAPRKSTLSSDKMSSPENCIQEKKKYTNLKSKKNNVAAITTKDNKCASVERTNTHNSGNKASLADQPVVYGKKSNPTVASKTSLKNIAKNGTRAKRSGKVSPATKNCRRPNSTSPAVKPHGERKNCNSAISELSSSSDNEGPRGNAPLKKSKEKLTNRSSVLENRSKVKRENGQDNKSTGGIFDPNHWPGSGSKSFSEMQLPMLAQVACHTESYRVYSMKQPFHDHCYTTPSGKKELYQDKVPASKSDNESAKTAHNCNAELDEAIFRFTVATPTFPQIYVPLLPNASQVIEITEGGQLSTFPSGRNSCCSASHGSMKRECPSPVEDSKFHKRIKLRTGNKVVIPEEIESDDEEKMAESDPSSFQDNSNGIDVQDNTLEGKDLDFAVNKDVAECAKGSPGWERKLAIRCIRALRSKKKEDRGPLMCKICQDKTFTAQATLMYHYRSHAGIKPFTCSICNATFTRQHSLNYHMLIHNNKSRFMCGDCGRNFRHPSHFKEHQRRHTGETPYECGDCGFRFKTRNTYKRHLKTRHGKILTAQGIRQLSIEEFYKVRTNPRKKVPKPLPSPRKKDQETQWPDGEKGRPTQNSERS